MSEMGGFDYLVLLWFVMAGITFTVLSFVAAPYGRHVRPGWGPTVDNNLGWVIMEAPAALVFAACFFLESGPTTIPLVIFFLLWEVHYVHRAFIYPLTLREVDRRMPLTVAGIGLLFNVGNGYINGHYLFALSGGYPLSWLRDPRFLVGLGLFVAGYLVNRRSDRTLRNLRRPGEGGYKIPRGGFFRWISCPNYLGEIIEWMGWAVATWSVTGLAFAVWTFANLAPRAQANHDWYRETFADYPPGRKALVPKLW